jgi:hypothetical protein
MPFSTNFMPKLWRTLWITLPFGGFPVDKRRVLLLPVFSNDARFTLCGKLLQPPLGDEPWGGSHAWLIRERW